MSYQVKKAIGPVKLDAAWDSPVWSNAVELKLDYVFDRSSSHHPDTRIKMLYDDQDIYGLFQVKDQYVKAVAEKNQDQVCLDSCVEFFVKPVNAERYFNFEMNCSTTSKTAALVTLLPFRQKTLLPSNSFTRSRAGSPKKSPSRSHGASDSRFRSHSL